MAVVVERGRVNGPLQIPMRFEGVPTSRVREVVVLERVSQVAVSVGGRVPRDSVDFVGDAGVLADLKGTVYG